MIFFFPFNKKAAIIVDKVSTQTITPVANVKRAAVQGLVQKPRVNRIIRISLQPALRKNRTEEDKETILANTRMHHWVNLLLDLVFPIAMKSILTKFIRVSINNSSEKITLAQLL